VVPDPLTAAKPPSAHATRRPWPPCPTTYFVPRSGATVADRGAHDGRPCAILDEAYVAHVGFVVDAGRVLPMTGRADDALYLHGAAATPCCAPRRRPGVRDRHDPRRTRARALAFHHSMNYRSVVLSGRRRAEDTDEKARA
jgi:hypothetical protein